MKKLLLILFLLLLSTTTSFSSFLVKPSSLIIDKTDRVDTTEVISMLDSTFRLPSDSPFVFVKQEDFGDDEGKLGEYTAEDRTMTLNKNLNREQYESVFCHEFFHYLDCEPLRRKCTSKIDIPSSCVECSNVFNLNILSTQTPCFRAQMACVHLSSDIPTLLLLSYTISPPERFVRGGAEWFLSHQKGKEDIYNELMREELFHYPIYGGYYPCEFTELDKGYTKLFSDLGWLVKN